MKGSNRFVLKALAKIIESIFRKYDGWIGDAKQMVNDIEWFRKHERVILENENLAPNGMFKWLWAGIQLGDCFKIEIENLIEEEFQVHTSSSSTGMD